MPPFHRDVGSVLPRGSADFAAASSRLRRSRVKLSECDYVRFWHKRTTPQRALTSAFDPERTSTRRAYALYGPGRSTQQACLCSCPARTGSRRGWRVPACLRRKRADRIFRLGERPAVSEADFHQSVRDEHVACGSRQRGLGRGYTASIVNATRVSTAPRDETSVAGP